MVGVGLKGTSGMSWWKRGCGREQFVVDIVGDERCGEFAKVLLESAGDGVDVEVRIRDVVIVGTFKAFFDPLNLAVASGFAIDSFEIHAYELD